MADTFVCFKCGNNVVIGQRYCSRCGERFNYNCPTCSAPGVDNTYLNCPRCNHVIDWPSARPDSKTAPVRPKPEARPRTEPPSRPEPAPRAEPPPRQEPRYREPEPVYRSEPQPQYYEPEPQYYEPKDYRGEYPQRSGGQGSNSTLLIILGLIAIACVGAGVYLLMTGGTF